MLGPNGTGKTTTIEILEGFRHRDSGDVLVLGDDPQSAGRAWRNRIRIVLQSANDQAALTVAELVGHFSQYYPNGRTPMSSSRPSGSPRRPAPAPARCPARRRLDVALGMVGRPELLFLDEPTTGFDPEARRSLTHLLRIFTRLGVDDRTHAVTIALERGLLRAP